MSAKEFLDVKININGDIKNVQIQKGCSFENNGSIYRVNNDCLLSVFDKQKQQWEARNEITMTGYQFDTFQAVANNNKESNMKGIVLSKKDIDKALNLYKNSKLTRDISEFLKNKYRADSVKAYSADNAISAYITNGNKTTSATLIFKYGSANDAVKISKLPKDSAAVYNQNKKENIKTQKQDTVKKTESVEKPVATQKQDTAKKSATVQNTEKPPKTEKKESKDILSRIKDFICGTKEDLPKTNNISNVKHFIDNSKTAELPKLYKVKLKQVANSMGISEKELQKQIVKTANSTGYSEYFITHIISLEHFEKTVKKKKDGTLTAGFGHSTLRDKSLYKKQNKPVSARQAFNWLTSDIKYFTKVVKNLKINDNSNKTFGNYWNKLPLSVKEAMIDVAFNRDAKKLQNAEEYIHLRANIQNGDEYLPASAMRLRQDFSHYSYNQKLSNTHTTGLMERNCYRFLLAIRDFDSEYRASAKRRFENTDSYYSETLKLKRAKDLNYDAFLLENAWNKMN